MKQQLKNHQDECNKKEQPASQSINSSAMNNESNDDICFSFENVYTYNI